MPSKGGVTPMVGRPKPPPPRRKMGSRSLIAVAATSALIAFFLAGWVGYGIRADPNAGKQVRVNSTFSGSVSIVNQDTNAGCVQPDDGGRQVCSNFAVLGGGVVHQGDKVHAAHELVSTGGGNGYDLLLIYPRNAP